MWNEALDKKIKKRDMKTLAKVVFGGWERMGIIN